MNQDLTTKCKQWVDTLRNADDEQFAHELLLLREQGAVELIPELVAYLTEMEVSERRKHKVIELLADISSPAAKAYFMTALDQLEGRPELGLLLSVLWQSRLDFSDQVERFVRWAAEPECLIALEAITLIEEIFPRLDETTQQKVRAELRAEFLQTTDAVRQHLLEDLLRQLPEVPEDSNLRS